VVYKLAEQETPQGSVGRLKCSAGKKTYPHPKQVYRHRAEDGTLCGDLVAWEKEGATGEPLLVPVLRAGRLTGPLPSLGQARGRCAGQRSLLPHRLLELEPCEPYPVQVSEELEREAGRLAPPRGALT
jgi:nicotinate phosphoribosyltransferase